MAPEPLLPGSQGRVKFALRARENAVTQSRPPPVTALAPHHTQCGLLYREPAPATSERRAGGDFKLGAIKEGRCPETPMPDSSEHSEYVTHFLVSTRPLHLRPGPYVAAPAGPKRHRRARRAWHLPRISPTEPAARLAPGPRRATPIRQRPIPACLDSPCVLARLTT
jgi:hypothetical protein